MNSCISSSFLIVFKQDTVCPILSCIFVQLSSVVSINKPVLAGYQFPYLWALVFNAMSQGQHDPLWAPETACEAKDGFRTNVIFPATAILEVDGTIKVNYGAAYTVIAMVTASEDELVELCFAGGESDS